MRFVKVDWIDASHGSGAWCNTSELPKCDPMTSFGWLAVDDKTYVVLAGTHYTSEGADYWGQTIAIPRGMIVGMDDIDHA